MNIRPTIFPVLIFNPDGSYPAFPNIIFCYFLQNFLNETTFYLLNKKVVLRQEAHFFQLCLVPSNSVNVLDKLNPQRNPPLPQLRVV